ncbi:MAG: DUF3343 domain-containing protein [Candidatus Glassbacteria bacterium]
MAHDLLILFYSPSHAIRAEKVLHDAGLKAKIVAAPRKLTESCGLGLRLHSEEIDESLTLLSKMGVKVKGIHDPEK